MSSPQVRLANEIAAQFHHQEQAAGAAGIAQHIRSFWEPRMRADLLRHAATAPGSLDPLALAAVRLLQTGSSGPPVRSDRAVEGGQVDGVAAGTEPEQGQ